MGSRPVGRLARFSSTTSVLAHYGAELARSGWEYRQDYHGGNSWGEGYCKQRMMASFEFRGDASERNVRYSLSMSWNGVSLAECP